MSHGTSRLVDVAIERVPTDLFVVVLATVAVDLSLLFLVPGPTRFLLALPLLFVFPGYALVSGLFPSTASVRGVDLDGLERVALSVPASVTVLVAVGLATTGAGTVLVAENVLAALSLVVLWGAFVALLRRRRVPDDRRYDPTVTGAVSGVRTAAARVDGGAETGATVALAVAMVIAGATVGFGIAVPPESPGTDSLHLLTEGADGGLVAGGYPETMERGEPTTLILGVDNGFDESRSYTVVVQLERVGADGAVVDRTELDRLSATVGSGERWTRRYEVTPPTAGERLRLSYLLFVGDAPADPTRDDARHTTHIWVTVEP
jgi:uncharacterized membrane protein